MSIKSFHKDQRVYRANRFMELIASCGRRFFEYKHPDGREVSYFTTSERGHIYLWTEWKRELMYVSRYGPYKGFHHGGTLHSLVGGIVEFIKTGSEYFSEGFFDAKHWAYPAEDMQRIVRHGQLIGLIKKHP